MTTVVPTKQLTVSTVVAAENYATAITSIEVGDHIVYFSGGHGTARVFATTDGKKLHRRQAPDRGLRGLRIVDDELWLAGEYGTLAVTTDRAASWTAIDTPNSECLWDVVRDTKGAFWIGASGGKIIKAAKRDAKFKVVKHALKPRDDRADPRVELVPVGVMFPLFNAYWSGKTFVKPKGLKGQMSALAIAPSGTIVMVGDHGAIFRSTDGGASYKPVKSGVAAHFDDVAVVAGGFLAIGDKGIMRRSEDDGVTWKPMSSGTKEHLWAIGSWGGGAFVGGEKGIVLRIASPGDTYWKGATDDFAPKPIVAAAITALRAPTEAERAARFEKLFAEAEAAHGPLAAKVASPKFALDDHAKAIIADPDSTDEYDVLGDALQAAADPPGALLGPPFAGQEKAAAKHLKKHREALLGALATDTGKVKVEWRNGFIHTARVSWSSDESDDFDDFEEESEPEFVKLLATLLDERSAMFLQDLTLGIAQMIDNRYDSSLREIGRRPRPALRSLLVGDFGSEQSEISWSDLGDASRLCGACDRLEKLTLRSGKMSLGKPGQLVFPRLRELSIITGGLKRESLKALEKAHLPSLERLTIYFGTSRYGGDIKRKDVTTLLASERFPRLTHLGLCNSEFADELCQVLHLSPLVAQVKSLDLSMGTLSDTGAHALATFARGLAHLEKLDVSRSYISPAAIRQLEKALPNADIATETQEANQFERRYVTIGE